jgi:hypothetical protein
VLGGSLVPFAKSPREAECEAAARRSTAEAAHWVLTVEATNVPSKPAASWGSLCLLLLGEGKKGQQKGLCRGEDCLIHSHGCLTLHNGA